MAACAMMAGKGMTALSGKVVGWDTPMSWVGVFGLVCFGLLYIVLLGCRDCTVWVISQTIENTAVPAYFHAELYFFGQFVLVLRTHNIVTPHYQY